MMAKVLDAKTIDKMLGDAFDGVANSKWAKIFAGGDGKYWGADGVSADAMRSAAMESWKIKGNVAPLLYHKYSGAAKGDLSQSIASARHVYRFVCRLFDGLDQEERFKRIGEVFRDKHAGVKGDTFKSEFFKRLQKLSPEDYKKAIGMCKELPAIDDPVLYESINEAISARLTEIGEGKTNSKGANKYASAADKATWEYALELAKTIAPEQFAKHKTDFSGVQKEIMGAINQYAIASVAPTISGELTGDIYQPGETMGDVAERNLKMNMMLSQQRRFEKSRVELKSILAKYGVKNADLEQQTAGGNFAEVVSSVCGNYKAAFVEQNKGTTKFINKEIVKQSPHYSACYTANATTEKLGVKDAEQLISSARDAEIEKSSAKLMNAPAQADTEMDRAHGEAKSGGKSGANAGGKTEAQTSVKYDLPMAVISKYWQKWQQVNALLMMTVNVSSYIAGFSKNMAKARDRKDWDKKNPNGTNEEFEKYWAEQNKAANQPQTPRNKEKEFLNEMYDATVKNDKAEAAAKKEQKLSSPTTPKHEVLTKDSVPNDDRSVGELRKLYPHLYFGEEPKNVQLVDQYGNPIKSERKETPKHGKAAPKKDDKDDDEIEYTPI